MRLLVYHFTIPNFTAHVGLYRQLARHSMALLVLPFLGAALTDYTTRPKNLPDIPFYHFLAYLAPSVGLRFRLAHLLMGLLVYLLYHFAYFTNHAGLYRRLSPDHTGPTISRLPHLRNLHL